MKKSSAIKALVVLAAILVIVLVVVKIRGSPTGNVVKDVKDGEIKEFKLKAFRFEYTPSDITVKKGDKVKITVENTDTVHGINIPDFGVSGTESVEFVANKEGEFNWHCNVMCGEKHNEMGGKLIVKP